MDQFFTYNGKLFAAGTAVFAPTNRAFRYGDSLFETIRLNKGHLPLFNLHFERLIKSLQLLGFEVPGDFTPEFLRDSILTLAQKNDIKDYGRVRLTIFRKEASLNEPFPCEPGWLIECSLLPDNYQRFNEDGYTIDIATGNTKGSGPLSNLKSGNYLLYLLAAQFARELKVNECLVLNNQGNIADSSIFNVFVIRNRVLYTPSLDQSPIAGVMRRHLIRHFQESGAPVRETSISISDLESADEVFLTNALFGIRWVKSFRSYTYENEMTRQIYFDLFQQNMHGVV